MLNAMDPTRNHLLAALPQATWARLQDHLECVKLSHGQMLLNVGRSPAYAYFPTSAILSMMYVTASGHSCELAVMGREGMVGASALMSPASISSTPTQVLVTSPGAAFRLKTQVLLDEIKQSSALLHIVLRHIQSVITQVSQQAVCNRHHSLDQHLAKWLMTRLDRMDGQTVRATHESIAQMLGVRREGVTASALKLQKAGLISYGRGQIEVLDRQGLRVRACECYAVVEQEHTRLLWPLSAEQTAHLPLRSDSPAIAA
jgi:CRP-like cAMP-binding protein